MKPMGHPDEKPLINPETGICLRCRVKHRKGSKAYQECSQEVYRTIQAVPLSDIIKNITLQGGERGQ